MDRPPSVRYLLSMQNLLPYDGQVTHYGVIFDDFVSHYYFDELMQNIKWENDQAKIFGKTYVTKRKVAWYGSDSFPYTYSKVTKLAQLWTEELSQIKSQIESITQESYNSCLLNLYHNGLEGMAWHSDGEKDLEKHGAIASLSFGASRKFCFKHKKTKLKVDVQLENGSLIVMKGSTQDNWWHRLPPTKKVLDPRINLTFRKICPSN